VRKNRADPDAWLELGRLFEARAAMTKEFVNKKFFLRYCCSIALALSIGVVSIFYFSMQHGISGEKIRHNHRLKTSNHRQWTHLSAIGLNQR